MKTIWVILIFMVSFNIFAIFTTSLNIFQVTAITPAMNEGEIIELTENSTNVSRISVEGAFGFGFDWSNIASILAGIVIAAPVIAIAYFTRSPVPLGVGAFLAFTVALWVKTYFVFNQFGVNQYFLTAGMVGMGIMYVATIADMMAQQQVN